MIGPIQLAAGFARIVGMPGVTGATSTEGASNGTQSVAAAQLPLGIRDALGVALPAAVLAADLLFARVPSAPVGGAMAAPTLSAQPVAIASTIGSTSASTRREPVILVHGFASSPASMESYAEALRRDGHDVTVVEMPDNAKGDIDASSAVLAKQVEAVKRRTGSSRVDLVGHSEGGLISRNYVENHGGADSVDSVVTLGTPNNGVGFGPVTSQAVLGSSFMRALLPTAVQQMLAGSGFLGSINGADGRLDPRVRYTSVYNGQGDGVVAADSSRLTGATNVALPNSLTRTHGGLLTDDLAYASVVKALDVPNTPGAGSA